MMRLLFVSILLGLGIAAKAQTNLYVDSSVSASGAGSSWSSAFRTLGEALDQVNTDSTLSSKYVINVAKGTYYPTGSDTLIDRDSTFGLFRGGVKIYGGFPSGGGVRDIAANPTILSGEIGAPGPGDNSYHVMVISGVSVLSDSVVLNGLTFRDAFASSSATRKYNYQTVSDKSGGGLYIAGVATVCFISDCNFYQNSVQTFGGAALVNESKTSFYNCVFDSNSSYDTSFSKIGNGGALSIANSTLPVTILKCAFRNCVAKRLGGAISMNNGVNSIIDSCEFTANTTGSQGGAIYATFTSSYSGTLLSNSTFTSNLATGTGLIGSGGAYYGTSTADKIVNCSFKKNYARSEAGGVGSLGIVRLCTFDGNSTDEYGGAGRLANADSCLFINNTAGLSGGALTFYTFVSNNIVSNSRFFADTAANGGGAIYINSSATVANCTIGKNVASYGAGIYTEKQNFTLRNSVISGNIATINGGGLYSRLYSYSATNCLLSGNKALGNGGAIFDSSSNPTITTCTIAQNQASLGNGIYNTYSSPVLKNSIVWDGTAGIANSNGSAPVITYCIVDGIMANNGNTNGNPLFINPLSASAVPDTGGVFDIMPCSPAVNTGSNNSANGTKDVAGRTRQFGINVDRGAFESQISYPAPMTGKSTVCGNDTIRLAVAVGGGTWSSSNTAVAIVYPDGVVEGRSAGGSATITYSLGGTCPNTVTKSITVYPATPLGPISGKTALCLNDTIHLSNNVTGGYWYNTRPAIGNLTSIGEFKGVAAGTDTVFYTTANVYGCRDTVSSVITVNGPPTVSAISGPSLVCDGDFVTFTNATPGGIWSSYGGLIYTLNSSGQATMLKPGTDSVRYTVTNTAGCRSYAQKVFTVNSLPTVAINYYVPKICWNSNPVFTASIAGGIWKSDDNNVATIDASGTVTPVSSGPAWITYTYTNASGCSATASVHVLVTRIDTQVIVSGNVLRSNQAGATYQWLDCDNGDMPIPGATDRNFAAPKNGHYSVNVVYEGCLQRSECVSITGLGIAGGTRYDQGLTVVPNPSSTSATIRLQHAGSYHFSLRDPSGKVLRQQTFTGTELSLDLSDYASGVYFIEMISGAERLTQKLQILR